MRRFGLAFSLVLVWVFLWGELSVANVLSGTAVSIALLAAFPGDRPDTWVRLVMKPLPFLRLLAYFVHQLVMSNLQLMRQTLRKDSELHTAVLACPLQTTSLRLITTIMNTMALTPGTMPIELELEEEPPTLYVHVLYTHDVEPIRRSIDRLQTLVVGAFAQVDRSSNSLSSLTRRRRKR